MPATSVGLALLCAHIPHKKQSCSGTCHACTALHAAHSYGDFPPLRRRYLCVRKLEHRPYTRLPEHAVVVVACCMVHGASHVSVARLTFFSSSLLRNDSLGVGMTQRRTAAAAAAAEMEGMANGILSRFARMTSSSSAAQARPQWPQRNSMRSGGTAASETSWRVQDAEEREARKRYWMPDRKCKACYKCQAPPQANSNSRPST